MGDGRDAGLGGELVVGLEALGDVAELGEDLRGVTFPARGKDMTTCAGREVGDGMLDCGG